MQKVTPNSNIQPGDLVLAHSRGAFAVLIRFGQWLRPSWRPWKRWNHTAIVVGIRTNGKIRCMQMGRRGEIVNIDEVSPKGYYIVRPCPKGVDRVKAVDYALRQNGIKYSVATIFSIALTLLTPKIVAVDFRRRGNALICSALVARSWEHGGWLCPSDPFQITPAELAWITQPKGQLP